MRVDIPYYICADETTGLYVEGLRFHYYNNGNGYTIYNDSWNIHCLFMPAEGRVFQRFFLHGTDYILSSWLTYLKEYFI